MALPDYEFLFPAEEEFVAALQASSLASLRPEQLQDERRFLIPQATEFIGRVREAGGEPEFAVVSRWLHSGANGKASNAFGADYAELRSALMKDDRAAFDQLFAPLHLDSGFDTGSLDYGGLATLFWLGFRAVVSPERCARLSRLGEVYSVTTLFGLLADAAEELSPEAKELLSRRADLDDDGQGWNTLLARYQCVGALWAAAYSFAARKRRVLIALLDG